MIEPERRNLAWTPRWGIVRVNRRQSVAEHMYFTACYTNWLADKMGLNNAEYRLIMWYMLKHDESECFMSDIPGPVKRRVKGNLDEVETEIHDRIFERMPPLDARLKTVKKLADVMDECFYLAGELVSGNKAVVDVYNGCRKRLTAACLDLADKFDEKHAVALNLIKEIEDSLDAELNLNNKIVQELVGQ